jgi:hypothetical protein
MRTRRFLNGLIYGSARGPMIEIDWDQQKVILHRFPDRLARRVTRWLAFT